MPTASQLFWLQLARFATNLHPALVAGYLAALDEVRKRFPTREVEHLIRIGDATGVAALIMATPTMQHAFLNFRTAIRTAISTAAEYFTRDVPPTRVDGNLLRVQFDALDPRTVQAVRSFEKAVLEESGATIKDAIVQAVERGLAEGTGPAAIARGIRDIIGLTPTQEVWVRNLRDELVRGDLAALERRLLDKRFVSTIRRAFEGDGLTAEQIERIVASYRKRMIAYHADTAARTVAINSMKLGQVQIWQQSIEQGVVAAEDVESTWKTKLDGRERPTHHEMNGTTIQFGARWYVPGVGYVSYPGEKEFNCRCAQVIRVKRKAVAA